MPSLEDVAPRHAISRKDATSAGQGEWYPPQVLAPHARKSAVEVEGEDWRWLGQQEHGREVVMSDVTGPISTLPGARHHVPDDTMCDHHPARKAVVRIQGETDSFGSEMHDLCEECAKADRAQEPDIIGACDWCKAKDVRLQPRRDIEEGSHGPVYYVCKPCSDKDEKAILDELARYEPLDYYAEDDRD